MLIAGLYMVIFGRTGLGGEKSLRGKRARIAGLILLAPILFTFCLGLLSAASDKDITDRAMAVLGVTWYMALSIALAYINFHIVSRETKTRGGCLTIWLGSTLLGGLLIPYWTLQHPAVPVWMSVAGGIAAVFQMISIVGVWMWKKWGVFALIASLVMNWVLSALFQYAAYPGSPIPGVITSALGSTITLYLLLRPKWHFFGSRETGPEEESPVIRQSLDALLSSRVPGEQGGYVIFGGSTDLDYVQYALDEGGLLLNWPTFQKRGVERLPLFVEILTSRGFIDRSPKDSSSVDGDLIRSLLPGQMCIADDGLYAQCGRDVETVADLTAVLLDQVFQLSDVGSIKVTLRRDG
jgi:hypothetical protein